MFCFFFIFCFLSGPRNQNLHHWSQVIRANLLSSASPFKTWCNKNKTQCSDISKEWLQSQCPAWWLVSCSSGHILWQCYRLPGSPSHWHCFSVLQNSLASSYYPSVAVQSPVKAPCPSNNLSFLSLLWSMAVPATICLSAGNSRPQG